MLNLKDPIYSNETAARTHMKEIRWASGAYCPHCGNLENVKAGDDARRHQLPPMDGNGTTSRPMKRHWPQGWHRESTLNTDEAKRFVGSARPSRAAIRL